MGSPVPISNTAVKPASVLGCTAFTGGNSNKLSTSCFSMNRDKKKEKNIARERIAILFKEAENIFKKNPELANRHVELARKLAMKIKLKMSSKFKRKFCKHCNAFLFPGINCRVRTCKSILLYYCLNCRKYSRIPFRKEKAKTLKKKQNQS